MSIDFKRAASLFVSSEQELAQALGLNVEEVRRYIQAPGSASDDLMERLAALLVERGQGMARVGEMIREDLADE